MLGVDIFVIIGSRNRLADNASYTLQPEVSSELALGRFSKRKHDLKTLNKVNNKYI